MASTNDIRASDKGKVPPLSTSPQTASSTHHPPLNNNQPPTPKQQSTTHVTVWWKKVWYFWAGVYPLHFFFDIFHQWNRETSALVAWCWQPGFWTLRSLLQNNILQSAALFIHYIQEVLEWLNNTVILISAIRLVSGWQDFVEHRVRMIIFVNDTSFQESML